MFLHKRKQLTLLDARMKYLKGKSLSWKKVKRKMIYIK
ncbi:hypothetical protein VCBJG01_0788 [Vibrio cholerae BJG-01]|nr:hypothetical protein VCBJG01_0788 [Vibrio cholerae BJG-01]